MASSVEADHALLGAGLMCAAREGRRGLGTPKLTGSATCPDGRTAPRDPLHALALAEPRPGEFRQSAATHAAEALAAEC